MSAAIFVNLTPVTHSLTAAALPGAPSPSQFFAFMVWMVLPITLGTWVVYYQHMEKLRKMQRRLRQLEARLRSSIPEQTDIRISPVLSAALPARPSSLTARILTTPGPTSPSPFSQPVVGPGH